MDLFQRKADEFQRNDLFEPDDVGVAIGAITGTRPAGLQQTQSVIVMQRANRDAGPLGKSFSPVGLRHRLSLSKIVNYDVPSASRVMSTIVIRGYSSIMVGGA